MNRKEFLDGFGKHIKEMMTDYPEYQQQFEHSMNRYLDGSRLNCPFVFIISRFKDQVFLHKQTVYYHTYHMTRDGEADELWAQMIQIYCEVIHDSG